MTALPAERILSVDWSPAFVWITFRSVPGNIYELECTEDLASGSWTAIVPNVVAESWTTTVADPGASQFAHRFYRIHLYGVRP